MSNGYERVASYATGALGTAAIKSAPQISDETRKLLSTIKNKIETGTLSDITGYRITPQVYGTDGAATFYHITSPDNKYIGNIVVVNGKVTQLYDSSTGRKIEPQSGGYRKKSGRRSTRRRTTHRRK